MNKPDMGARLYSGLIEMATDPEHGLDMIKLIQHIAGLLVETYLVFDKPDEAMAASFQKLARMMGVRPAPGFAAAGLLPPAHMTDYETERGRLAARVFFEEWLDCAFEFHNLILVIVQHILLRWEEDGISRAEALRLLIECARKCMGYELAAQELCDVVIDRKIAQEGWSLGDCVASLSAVSGRRLALSLGTESCTVFRGCELPDALDRVIFVMTQEAVRLGVPAGTDWRFGLAANDMPVNAPIELIYGIEPYCQAFFDAIHMINIYEQSVSCAKAAGRMLAVAAGGELPEIEPAIAKPLAMAAMTETYKSVCMRDNMATV